MGVLEASGLSFDALWVMGATQEFWPAPARPNPFIPYALQRSHQTPHSTPDRELAVARTLLLGFREGADTVMFSIARHELAEETHFTRLLEDIPMRSLEELGLSPGVSCLRRLCEAHPRLPITAAYGDGQIITITGRVSVSGLCGITPGGSAHV
jgi:inactivated superfamily I helicase